MLLDRRTSLIFFASIFFSLAHHLRIELNEDQLVETGCSKPISSLSVYLDSKHENIHIKNSAIV